MLAPEDVAVAAGARYRRDLAAIKAYRYPMPLLWLVELTAGFTDRTAQMEA